MLAPEDDKRTTGSQRSRLASDIVELVVLSVDEAFLQTLREAIGPSRRLWQVPTSDKVGDMLLAGGVGILVVDAQALRQAGAPFVTRIKQQFPDLVIVVAGTRDTEAELARLISEGTVYRFIHKPMSPARAKLFADAAVRRYEDRRRRAGGATPRSGPPLRTDGLMIVGGCAAICAVAGGLWMLTRGGRQTAGPAAPARTATEDAAVSAESRAAFPSADPGLLARASEALVANRLVSPAGENALELYSQALAREPGNSDARLGIAAVRERLLARAVNAMMEDRLDEAAAAIEIARRAGAPSGRISLLAAELAKARSQGMARAAPAHAAAAHAAGAGVAYGLAGGTAAALDPADRAAEPAMQRIREGASVEPERDKSAAAERRTEAAAAPGRAEQPAHEDRGAAARPADPADPAAVIDSGKLVVVKSVQPEYPRKARDASIEGWVELEFTVTESGRVTNVSVRAANPPGVFDRAALDALSEWRYKPALIDARPVSQRARIRIRFALAR